MNITAIGPEHPTVRAGGHGSLDRHAWDTIAINQTNPHNPEEERKFHLGDNARSLKSNWSPQQETLIIHSRARVQKDNLLLSSEDTRMRRFTPVECERLQSFPDGWTSGLSDTQRYKCLGNAVTVNVIEFLGHRIKEVLR